MTRRSCLWAGLAVLAACWLALPALAARSFSAHMTMHMGVVAIAAGLLALGIAGGPRDPVPRHPALFSPLLASLVELVVVWAWHAPVPHAFARHTALGLALEQGSFLASGLYLWLAVLGGDRESRRERAAGGVLGLLLTSMHMTLLGALLALAPRPVYGHRHGGLGLGPLEDQHLGGAIMLLVGGAAYLAGGLGLAVDALRGGARGGRA